MYNKAKALASESRWTVHTSTGGTVLWKKIAQWVCCSLLNQSRHTHLSRMADRERRRLWKDVWEFQFCRNALEGRSRTICRPLRGRSPASAAPGAAAVPASGVPSSGSLARLAVAGVVAQQHTGPPVLAGCAAITLLRVLACCRHMSSHAPLPPGSTAT